MPTMSQTVNVGTETKGTNWVGILIGVIFVLVLCIGAIYSYRMYMENQGAAPVEPTQPAAQPTQAPPIIILPSQPPAVTEVQPTREPRPTNPPNEKPTQPPEQPTQPVAQQPEVEQPIAPPAQETPGTGILPCGSALLIFVPMFVMGASRMKKRDSA
jgi:outer membrane biosynthesis protein TonB